MTVSTPVMEAIDAIANGYADTNPIRIGQRMTFGTFFGSHEDYRFGRDMAIGFFVAGKRRPRNQMEQCDLCPTAISVSMRGLFISYPY